ncbi:hypothetical protein B0H16DRAFT_254005 [Mycena metata]|uniref:CRIB domain-containing protein n=1 Tax=Mycena metata TaxID=1033252 RepID=A0AAD7JPN4_9AGAR|nr:hypothetical protein B0H16DRAFT_254005 [Mycena metata]
MSFTYQLRIGGSYSLDTHIRFQPPFKMSVMKLTKRTAGMPSSLSNAKDIPESDSSDDDLEVPLPPPMKDEVPIREGAVRMKVSGVHPRGWFFKLRWVVLCEKQLEIHPSPTKPVCSRILLSDIVKVQRTDRLPYGLSLQTKQGRRHLLSFDNDSHLYEWQDDITSHFMGVSPPYNFVHQVHAGLDPLSGNLTGLPPTWEETLLDDAEAPPMIRISSTDSEPAPPVEKISLRVNLRISSDERHLCSVLAPPQVIMQDVLQHVCSEMRFSASDYDLAISGGTEPLASDLTVEGLDGKHEIVLVRQPRIPIARSCSSTSGEYRDLILAVVTPANASPRRPPPYKLDSPPSCSGSS